MERWGNPWLYRTNRKSNAKVRLICFPYAGGSPSLFRSWADAFDSRVEVISVHFPGRGARFAEQPITRIDELVQHISHGLIHVFEELPFAFIGHSMGALVCYELTRHLQREHKLTPEHLFVSAHRAPQLLRMNEDQTYKLSDRELRHKLRQWNGTPEWVLHNEELMEIALPIIRADLELCETYQYLEEGRLNVPITAFAGSHDPLVSIEEAAKWGDVTEHDFDLKIIEGDHFFIHNHVPRLTAIIQEQLMTGVR